eukprot:TRINITY_DN5204_c0_g1_i1.p1 TRINITY_DN5204_c0_g1~~TRINITY_DN5204_c0_g1_i1.p1  ORF type:complete len:402 (-),score=182.40 TRINITY_DN5204_c0_g1_i1:897-2057(-)
MATQEIAAMLDELMGRNRNAHPNEKVAEISWEDSSVCRYFLVQFCPHDLFTNTKADLGACPKIHDDELRRAYLEAPDGYKKQSCQDDFLRFSQRMLNDLGNKIKRAKERLLLTQMEQAAANGISPQQQEEIEEKINILTDKINTLVDQAEQAGCQGDVEEAQGLLKLCDQLKGERDELKQQIGLKGVLGQDGQFGPPKAMEVCEVCGAFLIVGDAQQRIDDHLMGKLHVGYARLRASVDQLLEERRRVRDIKEKEKDKEIEERRKRREEGGETVEEVVVKREVEKRKSRERDTKSKDRKRSRSKDRRRSRSKDRKHRDRSRDRGDRGRGGGSDRRDRDRSRDRRDRDRVRDRSSERKRDREHRRHRSRSKDRKARDSKSKDRESHN